MTNPSSSLVFTDEFWKRLPTGIGIMLAQAVPANFCNQLSVHCSHHKVNTLQALRDIVQSPSPFSPKLVTKGLKHHTIKETLRVGAKVLAAVHQHTLTRQFPDTPIGRLSADLAFSGSLMAFEMLINPADTRRTMAQADQSLRTVTQGQPHQKVKGALLSHLYRGSLANGLRQGGIWYGYRPAERFWSKGVKDHTPFDTCSIPGIMLRTPPISIQILTPVWIFELAKNRLQNNPSLYHKTEGSRYLNALKDIYAEKGWRGFTYGYAPKVANICILVSGFL
ncbi:MAG: hypothetical protein K2P51_08885, partial [Rhabdochlamydiaceae bacterium]|nr:hypothetical protein [Rhabdochlamydiaceae bacterium]